MTSWTNGDEAEEHKPLPEETDYFYDDVVDLNDKTEFQRDSSTEKSVSTISPEILSHYVAGDTPTLYAGTRPANGSAAYTPAEHSPQNGSPADGTAFTFFGVPIPPLNLNNVWGQTKGKRTKDSRRNSLPKKPSTVDQDGFTPMLPGGTGGFRPMQVSTTGHTLLGEEETEDEEDENTAHRNDKSTSNKIAGPGNGSTTRYTTAESPYQYDRLPGNDYSYSRFVNITTRDSLFESATINSIVRSTAKPDSFNNLQQTAASDAIAQSDNAFVHSENPTKLSTGNFKYNCLMFQKDTRNTDVVLLQ